MNGNLEALDQLIGDVQEKMRQAESAETPDTDQIAVLQTAYSVLSKMAVNTGLIEQDFENREILIRPNQLEAVRKFAEFLSEAKSSNDLSGYFIQPTGSGKTVLFGIMARMIDVPTLILVPKVDLLEQTKDELVNVVGINPDDIGLVGSGQFDPGKKFVVATYQSHISQTKGSPDSPYNIMAKNVGLIICDEAHRSIGKKTIESLSLGENKKPDSLNAFGDEEMTEDEFDTQERAIDLVKQGNESTLKLGFTATPELASKSVGTHFGRLIARESYKDMVRAGILVPFVISQVETEMGITPKSNDQISIKEESILLSKGDVYRKLLEEYTRVKEEMEDTTFRTVVFCSSIKECDAFKELAEEEFNLRTLIFTSREERGGKTQYKNLAQEQLLNGEIDLLITVDKVTEGWNFRPLNAAIFARATLSPARLVQAAGRAAREYPGKSCAHIFEAKWKRRPASSTDSDSDSENSSPPPYFENCSGQMRIDGNKVPLSLAQALYELGEDPDGVCSIWSGESLNYEKREEIPDGYISINDLAENFGVKIENIRTIGNALKGNFEESILIRTRNSESFVMYYSPKLAERISVKISKSLEIAVIKTGWESQKSIAAQTGKSIQEITAVERWVIRNTPANSDENMGISSEQFRLAPDDLETCKCYSPRLAYLIKLNINPALVLPEPPKSGWEESAALRDRFHINSSVLNELIRRALDKMPEVKKQLNHVQQFAVGNTTENGSIAISKNFMTTELAEAVLVEIEELKPPQGWKDYSTIKNELNIDRTVDALDGLILESKTCIGEYGDFCLYYSPESFMKISEKVEAMTAPEGWVSGNDLGINLEQFPQITSEELGTYLPQKSSPFVRIMTRHFSPEAVKKIEMLTIIPEGYMDLRSLIGFLKLDSNSATSYKIQVRLVEIIEAIQAKSSIKELKVLEPIDVAKTRDRKFINYYPPELRAILQETIIPYSKDWTSRKAINEKLIRGLRTPSFDEIEGALKDLQINIEDYQKYMVVGDELELCYSPKLVELLEEKLYPSSKIGIPDGWKSASDLATEFGTTSEVISKRMTFLYSKISRQNNDSSLKGLGLSDKGGKIFQDKLGRPSLYYPPEMIEFLEESFEPQD